MIKENFYANFASEFKRARLAKGISINTLAKEADEQYTIVKRIEEGNPFSFHHIFWIQKYLDINVYEFIEEEKNYDESKGIAEGFDDLF